MRRLHLCIGLVRREFIQVEKHCSCDITPTSGRSAGCPCNDKQSQNGMIPSHFA